MTGEVYACLKSHSILGKLMDEGREEKPIHKEAFLKGVSRAKEGFYF